MESDVKFSRNENQQLEILGKEIFISDMASFWKKISILIDSKKPHLVITLNVDQTNRLLHSEKFRMAFKSASIVTLDGMPLVKLAKYLNFKNATRLTGADMLIDSCNFATNNALKICLLGGSNEIAIQAEKKLLKEFPALQIVHIDFPFVSLDELTDNEVFRVIDKLNKEKPNIVFICLGSPKQEIFFLENKSSIPACVYIGAGASVDFVGGSKKRAPKYFQKHSLEWMWRLAQEPKRLSRRYLISSWKIIPILTRTIRNHKKNGN